MGEDRGGPTNGTCVRYRPKLQNPDYCRVGQKKQISEDDQHLGDQHRLGPLAGPALHLGQLAPPQRRRPGGQRVADLGAVVGDQRERGGQVAQLVDADLLAEPAERRPGRDALQPGVRERVADAGRTPSRRRSRPPRSSASGTPRPPARFIETRSRNAPTTCRKSRRRAAASRRSCSVAAAAPTSRANSERGPTETVRPSWTPGDAIAQPRPAPGTNSSPPTAEQHLRGQEALERPAEHRQVRAQPSATPDPAGLERRASRTPSRSCQPRPALVGQRPRSDAERRAGCRSASSRASRRQPVRGRAQRDHEHQQAEADDRARDQRIDQVHGQVTTAPPSGGQPLGPAVEEPLGLSYRPAAAARANPAAKQRRPRPARPGRRTVSYGST